MIRAGTISLVALLAQCEDTPEADTDGPPSGLSYELQEAIFEPQGVHLNAVRVVRLRYVLPELGGDTPLGFETIEPDFQYLCDSAGLANLRKSAPNASEIVISIASKPVDFGATAPDITQFIDAFQVKNGACIWGGL